MSTIGSNPGQSLHRRPANLASPTENKSTSQPGTLDQSINELVGLFNGGQFDRVAPEKLLTLLNESLKADRGNDGEPLEPGTHFSQAIIKHSETILNFEQRIQFQKAVVEKLYESIDSPNHMSTITNQSDKEELSTAVENVDQMLVTAHNENADDAFKAKVEKVKLQFTSRTAE